MGGFEFSLSILLSPHHPHHPYHPHHPKANRALNRALAAATDVNGHEPADDDAGPRERYRLAFLEAPDNLAERVEKVAGFVPPASHGYRVELEEEEKKKKARLGETVAGVVQEILVFDGSRRSMRFYAYPRDGVCEKQQKRS